MLRHLAHEKLQRTYDPETLKRQRGTLISPKGASPLHEHNLVVSPKICSWGYHHYILHHLRISNNTLGDFLFTRTDFFIHGGRSPVCNLVVSPSKFVLEDILHYHLLHHFLNFLRVCNNILDDFLIHKDSPRLLVQCGHVSPNLFLRISSLYSTSLVDK